MSGLPAGWELRKLSEVVTKIIGGGTPSKKISQYWSGSIPWMSIKDMRTRRPADTIDHITQEAIENSATNLIPADTVIMATRVGLGKVVRVPYETTINQDLKALLASPGLDKSYLEYWLFSKASYLDSIGSGTTVKGIRLEQVRNLDVPLPPLPEQRRIVARIEEIFSRLDAGVAALRHAKAQLKRYRQSVLAAAVTGQLTQGWREQHPQEDQGKLPALFGMRLPNSWGCRALVEVVTEGPRNGFSPKCGDNEGGSRVLKLSATSSARMLLNKRTTKLSLSPVDPKSHAWLQPNDVLIQRANSLELLGSTAIYEGEPGRYVYPDLMMRVRLDERSTRKLLVLYLNSLLARNYFQRNATGVAGNMPKINGGTLKALPVPVPPLAEQHQIVIEVEARTTAIDRLEAGIDRQLNRSKRLRQSILATAFSAKL